MKGIVGLLDRASTEKVRGLWAELYEKHGLAGVAQSPVPHLTLHLAGVYDLDLLGVALEEIAESTASFPLRVPGLGIFTAPAPVLYLTVVKTPPLLALHQRIFSILEGVSQEASDLYNPDHWIPHITLAVHDLDAPTLADALRWLAARDLRMTIQIEEIALFHDPEPFTPHVLRFRQPLRGERE